MRNYIMYCNFGHPGCVDTEIIEAENIEQANEQAREYLMERVEYFAVPLSSRTAKEYGLESEYKALKEKGDAS